jgi:hypothetical protein
LIDARPIDARRRTETVERPVGQYANRLRAVETNGFGPRGEAAAQCRGEPGCGRIRSVVLRGRATGGPRVGDRDWFCPSLRIRHDENGFQIEVAEEATREFYAMALG